ncbi:MAG: helix-turn-helix transcriptional regulator [Acidobacteriota bacterium]|nr:MAG: helix-turn-helix transcriptional regulator [Acidobacteriota bacterium]
METNIKNNLWIARNRLGLELKQVAYLLSHQNPNLVSRYERGEHIPGLEMAFKLEVIYKMPVQKLFKDLYKQCDKEIRTRRAGNPGIYPRSIYRNGTNKLKESEFCSYDEFLKSHIPNEIELGLITKHIISLNNSVSGYKEIVN